MDERGELGRPLQRALWYFGSSMAALPEPFGEYELVQRLGVGGMAETFVAMILREARLSALLHHGHIARVLDFGVANGAHYLAL